MRKLILMLIVLFFAFSLIACVSTKAVRLGDQALNPRRPTVAWQRIQVYLKADQVPGKYEEIALLMATGDSIWSSEKGMWNSMKKKATKMGANAIILDATSEPSAATKIVGAFLLGIGGSRKGKALAIFIYPEEK